MDTTSDTGPAGRPQRATAPEARRPRAAPSPASAQPFGPDAATILATEHWSLLGFRSLIWNEAMSRATVFLSVLSAAIITLALLSNAAGGSHTTTLALVLLPVVLFLGIATQLATVDAALAAAIVVLAVRQAGALATIAVVTAAAAFLLVWAALVAWERHTLDPVAWTTPRFPTPPDHP
ncbi:MAG TPA: hypothetical protein VNW50_00785 [Streptosporangiaceae bacterium]|jgi:hypothetical protein|nr:hypothetical protein [Streptosporangiaceae bacterium]